MSISQGGEDRKTDINVCFRLKEERERIGLSQGGVAALLAVTSKTVWRWEKEIIIPSDKLAKLEEFGFDVMYVMTGNHQTVIHKMRNDLEEARLKVDTMRGVMEQGGGYMEDARELLALYNQSTEAGKAAIIATAKAVEKIKTGDLNE